MSLDEPAELGEAEHQPRHDEDREHQQHGLRHAERKAGPRSFVKASPGSPIRIG